jgi:hypothetical protein
MLGMEELKEIIEITETTVECPVKGCNEKVERQRKDFKREEIFKCTKHNIYISPTTFEYSSEAENLLWTDAGDKDLLDKIKLVKRECRMGRDNSEDAVTWNVFRFLEKNALVNNVLSSIAKISLTSSSVIYWSYNQEESHSYSELDKARILFGEEICKSSEPDIIIETDRVLFFIEAKLTANNETPSKKDIDKTIENPKKYTTGGENWFDSVFTSHYKTIIRKQKYELLRFWLIGTWIAKQRGLDFYLINLVLSDREKNIEPIFRKHINETKNRKFLRITWEDICKHIMDSTLHRDKDSMIRYFKNKTIGYEVNEKLHIGKLQRAFSII